MTSTPDQFFRKMEKLSRELPGASRKGVNYAAGIMVAAVDANIAGAIGADMELSGVRFGTKRKFNTKRPEPSKKIAGKLLPSTSDVKPTAIVKGAPAGMFTIVESGAKPHMVGGMIAERNAFNILTREAVAVRVTAKRQRESKIKDKRKFMSSGIGGNIHAYGPFVAGGSPGKKPFASALKTVGPRVSQIIARETALAQAKAFR